MVDPGPDHPGPGTPFTPPPDPAHPYPPSPQAASPNEPSAPAAPPHGSPPFAGPLFAGPPFPGPPFPGPPFAAPPHAGPPKRNWLPLILGLVGVLLVLCCGGGTAATFLIARNADRPVPATTAPTPERAPATATPRAAPTGGPTSATPPSKAAPLPADAVYEGRGDKVVRLRPLDEDHRHYVTFTHRGSSNFAVWSTDADGDDIDLVANEIGKYQGSRPLDFRDTPASLRVEADGSWKIVVRALERAPVWPSMTAGRGDVVLLVRPGTVDDVTGVRVTHKGRDNFVVHAYGESVDLLVNEIGRFSGDVPLPGDTIALAVEGDGSWTLKPR